MPTKNIDLPTLIERFHDEDACHHYLEVLRWPEGVTCPGREKKDGSREECGSDRIARLKKRRLFECQECGYQFSTRVGTIFHDSKLPLWKWFLAVYIMAQSKKGVSANQLKRMLGVSYKTAWYLCHRIRRAMEDENEKKLTGTVEVDETLVGGKVRGKGYGYRGNKSIVIAAVQREGGVRLRMIDGQEADDFHEFVEAKVSPFSKAIHTDEHPSYSGVTDGMVPHRTINHSSKEWVNGQVHTNTVEGVFSLLKRSIVGSYHKVSVKHLPAYLDEVEWRYNNRKNPYLFRDTLLELIACERMEYRKLTAS